MAFTVGVGEADFAALRREKAYYVDKTEIIYELVQAINSLPADQRVPVIAIGGIATWQDAVEFIMAGASAVAVGAMNFVNPTATIEAVEGIEAFMKQQGIENVTDLIGCVE